ncbi:uncharacterized protein LOC129573628 isoform X2 [Sitodiplosis mosellana]|uniref:uncharacterized protein LOC129573628 isoform X2 n=1 Tax=Sitodiplosis mosellana TaxID=263140 RepID=UPI002443AECB|nr:uncharacterized protein LOC129573628 isoform X2 [Sitodiplosis mosellana]
MCKWICAYIIITDIKYNSPAHISGKIEDGDEIIQINYQTVVGWNYKRVLQQLQESPPDVLLTLKKRPRHTKIYGQIYMKPYRLPSKKRSVPYRFGENLPSPRIEFIPSQNFPVLLPLAEKSNLTDSDSSSSSSILISAEATKSNEKDIRLYLSKPRAVLQRRNTICGDHFSGFRGNITFWHEMNVRRNMEGNSLSLRDKSVSFGFGLEISSDKRPITCIGIGHNNDKFGDLGNTMKGSLPDMKHGDKRNNSDVNDNMIPQRIEVQNSLSDEVKSKHETKAKVVKFETPQDVISHLNEFNEDAKVINVIEEKHCKQDKSTMTQIEVPDLPIKLKHKDEDKPPEIGPRKEFLKKVVAPKPPPRPSKAAEMVQRKFDTLKQERENNTEEICPVLLNIPCETYVSKCTVINVPKVSEIGKGVPPIDASKKNDETQIDKLQSPSRPIILSKHNNSDSINEETELLTPNKTKTLTLKKKNSMLAKRRKIGLKALEFSDIQGHLFRRTKDKHGVTYWAKLYFVLVETALYGFRTKKSQKANCLIFLPGFTISLAKEVHSKPFAYKVYHPKKTFYFAAESQEALSQWMDYIKRATLKGGTSNIDPMLVDRIENKDLFSETDSSEDESELANGDTLQPILFRKAILGSGSKSTKKRNQNDEFSPISTNSKSDKYHLGFGSLKKFTNLHNLPFSSNKSDKEREERKKSQSDIPVPTAQYKSYRKIPGNAGMQLGQSNTIDYNLMAQRRQQSHVRSNTSSVANDLISEQFAPKSNESGNEGSGLKSHTPAPCSSTNTSIVQDEPTVSLGITPNSTKSKSQMISNGFNPSLPLQTISHDPKHAENKPTLKLSKSKTSPFNYMHASNPNLVEFAFQTSKNLDVGMPKLSNAFDQHQNLQGLITLKDLMLQREEDEAHNMYNNRVNLGVEKPNDRYTKRKNRRANEVAPNENNRATDYAENIPQVGQKPSLNKIQRRSLPRTPDYAQSFKADDTEIIMARSKEGQKLRDFGYEFISGGDDSVNVRSNGINNTTTIVKKSIKPAVLAKPSDRFILPTKKKSINWMGLTRSDEDKIIGKGSLRIVKQKHLECAGDVNRTKTTDSINCLPANEDRKGSAASTHSYLSKLTFPNKTVKEKRLLGSPRLHRAASSIFGRKNIESPTCEQQNTRLFVDVDQNNGGSSANAAAAIPISHTVDSQSLNEIDGGDSAALNYMSFQNIQFPPVFVPETYSLRDPNSTN